MKRVKGTALAAAQRAAAKRLESGRLDEREIDKRVAAFIQRVNEFNKNWDRDLEFFIEQAEDWMEDIPALWIKPLPFPHPAFSGNAVADWRDFLAQQRRTSGQEAAYLTNAAREENTILRQIVVSRVWLWVALTGDIKVGSDEFWDLVLDDVVRELPNWTVPIEDDLIPPDTKTLRNIISVRAHKRFLDRITAVKISRDG